MNLDNTRDYILIRDGDSPMSKPIVRLTGELENNQRIIMSTGSQIYLYFKTNVGDTRRGFRLRFTQGCTAPIIGRNGTQISPAYGLTNYPSNQECLYKIKNPGGGPLSLNFNDFEVDKSDFIRLRWC